LTILFNFDLQVYGKGFPARDIADMGDTDTTDRLANLFNRALRHFHLVDLERTTRAKARAGRLGQEARLERQAAAQSTTHAIQLFKQRLQRHLATGAKYAALRGYNVVPRQLSSVRTPKKSGSPHPQVPAKSPRNIATPPNSSSITTENKKIVNITKRRATGDDKLSHTELPIKSCVKIFTTEGATPTYLQPWQVSDQSESYGSGFAVTVGGEWRLLTNAHVVDGAVGVRVARHSESRKHRAEVIFIAHDLDLALLDVSDKSFRQKVPPLEMAEDLPPQFSEVRLIGFPEGGNTICVTKGVVSRIDAQLYAHAEAKGISESGFNNPGKLLIVQIDAAVNSGNSGGPAIDEKGRVLGVASSSLDEAQNVGYVIPTCLVSRFLAEVNTTGQWGGVSEPGMTYRLLESPGLREYLELPEGRTGVLITSIAPLGAIASYLSEGDVLMKIDGHNISNEGTIVYEVANGQEIQLPFEHVITSKHQRESTELEVLKAGTEKKLKAGTEKKVTEVSVDFAPIPPLLPRFDGYDCQPPYFVIGGFVFTKLSTPLVKEYNDNEDNPTLPAEVLEKVSAWRLKQEEVVILVQVLQHPVNEGVELETVRILQSINDHPVTSMDGLVREAMGVLKNGTSRFLRFGFLSPQQKTGSIKGVEVLIAQDVVAANEEILERHHIPSPTSEDLMDTYSECAPSSMPWVMTKKTKKTGKRTRDQQTKPAAKASPKKARLSRVLFRR